MATVDVNHCVVRMALSLFSFWRRTCFVAPENASRMYSGARCSSSGMPDSCFARSSIFLNRSSIFLNRSFRSSEYISLWLKRRGRGE